MDLLASELASKEFVLSIGVERSTRILEAVCKRIKRRAKNGCTFGQFLTEDYVRKADWEVELIFKLKMGLKLIDTFSTPEAARQRILARIEERKARARLRKQSAA